MRRSYGWMTAALALAVLLAGCGKKSEQTASTSADSLLASSPVEPPQGNLNPDTSVQQPAPPKTETPPPAAKPAAKPKPKPAAPAPVAHESPGVTVPAGTPIKLKIETALSTETSHVGDAWEGTVSEPVVIGTAAPIPAGSKVHGTVDVCLPAEKGSRATLVLSVDSIDILGTSHSIHATADSMIAGSTRTRNVGAVAGGAAAGALIGHAIGGGKGAVIGGLLGGGAAAGGVAASKGYQVVVKQGEDLTFKTTGTNTLK